MEYQLERWIYHQIQSQSNKQLQLVYWATSMPHFAGKTHQDRFKLNFAKNKFTLKITKTEYEDSGNYSLVVQLTLYKEEKAVVTLNVYGRFFSYCRRLKFQN